jgi:hypothetical protein
MCCLILRRYDDVNLTPDQLGGEFREPFHPARREAVFHDEIPSLDQSKFVQPLLERSEIGVPCRTSVVRQIPDAWDMRWPPGAGRAVLTGAQQQETGAVCNAPGQAVQEPAATQAKSWRGCDPFHGMLSVSDCNDK